MECLILVDNENGIDFEVDIHDQAHEAKEGELGRL